MSCIQFFVSGILCLVPTVLLEHPHMVQLLAAWQPILYAGVLSCGVAYTLQIIGREGHESNGGFPDSQSGIRNFGAGRNSDPASDTDITGSSGLYSDVYCDSAGAASDSVEEKSAVVPLAARSRKEIAASVCSLWEVTQRIASLAVPPKKV